MRHIDTNNQDAEKSLIASILLKNKLFFECQAISVEDFWDTKHQKLYRAISTIIQKGEIADASSAWYQSKVENENIEVVKAEYIIDLIENQPVFEIKKYIRIVLECSITRKVKTKCLSILESTLVGDNILAEAQSEIMGIASEKKDDDIKLLKDQIQKHIDRIEKVNTQEAGMYYKLGFPNIDSRVKTIGPKLIIIAGRPGMGKTSLALTMIRNLDSIGVCSGLLSIEMPENEIVDRWLSMVSCVDSARMGKYKGMSIEDFNQLTMAASVLSESLIMIDASGSLDISDVERKCRKMKMEGAKVIFIDQLSHIGNREVRGGELTTRFSENVTRLSALKKELNIPIFLLAQLNRDLKTRGNKDPVISDLKQSGKIEEDADAIIFVHRPEEYADSVAEKKELKGKTILNLAKNRSGPTYRDNKIKFVHETTYFAQENFYG